MEFIKKHWIIILIIVLIIVGIWWMNKKPAVSNSTPAAVTYNLTDTVGGGTIVTDSTGATVVLPS